MAIDPERVKALFLAAIERDDSANRRAFLDQEIGDDAELRDRLDALMAAYDQPPIALDRPLGRRSSGRGRRRRDPRRQFAAAGRKPGRRPHCQPIGPTRPELDRCDHRRSLQAAPADRRGGYGLGLHGRAARPVRRRWRSS